MARDGGGGAEMVEEAVADLGPEGRAGLLGAAPRPGVRSFEYGAEARDVLPDFGDAGPFEGGDRAPGDLPFEQRGPQQPDGIGIIGGRAVRHGGELAIGL